MAHASFKILPGVDVNKTPALNEAAISQSQLIRFVPDRTMGGLVQKLGGWTKYPSATSTSTNSITRALWAWGDINNNSYLAVGNEGTVSGGALQVVSSGSFVDLTPTYDIRSVGVNFSTVSGSNQVTVTVTGEGINQYDVIWLKTQVSVGGLVLFGTYQCYNTSPVSVNDFIIYATDVLGNPQNATSTVTSGGAVPLFTTTINTANVNVTLNNHGYVAGDSFPVLISTSVGGIVIGGVYGVYQVVDANNFIIITKTLATASTTGSENAGNAYFYIYFNNGPQLVGTGYGVGYYGQGSYGVGTGSTIVGNYITAIDWTLDNWGEDLIACPYGGGIYYWSPSVGFPSAKEIANAPPVNNGAFVAMPQRQIMAWGSTYTGIGDPLQIRWCDVENFDSWTPTITNQAGGYRITRGSKIVQGLQANQQSLFWTDLGLWVGQYIGPPDAYGFNEVGIGCGLIGRKAAGIVNGIAYWMGQSQIYSYGGGAPTPIPCPIWDVAFQDLDRSYADNIRFAGNSRFGEVSWFFPIIGSNGVPTNYIKYNYILQQWDYGTLTRTAWINESILGPPIAATFLGGNVTNSYLVQHETSNDAVDTNGQPVSMNSYFQTGYFVLSDADLKMFVDQVWPDMKWGLYGGTQNANVLLTFYVADYAGQNPTAYGPFTLTQATTYVTPRFRGRLVSVRIESNDIGSFWRLGNIRYRVQQDGKY